MNKEIEICQIVSCDQAMKVFTKYKDYFSRSVLAEDESRLEYSKKIVVKGWMLEALLQNENVGFICGYANDEITRIGYVSFLAVEKELGIIRGRILVKLIKAAMKMAIPSDIKKVRIEVYLSNENALHIYKKLGFYQVCESDHGTIYMEMPLDELKKKYGSDTQKEVKL